MENIWKRAFKVLHLSLCTGTEGNTRKYCQDKKSPSRDSNGESPEQTSGASDKESHSYVSTAGKTVDVVVLAPSKLLSAQQNLFPRMFVLQISTYTMLR